MLSDPIRVGTSTVVLVDAGEGDDPAAASTVRTGSSAPTRPHVIALATDHLARRDTAPLGLLTRRPGRGGNLPSATARRDRNLSTRAGSRWGTMCAVTTRQPRWVYDAGEEP